MPDGASTNVRASSCMCPQGETYTQKKAEELSAEEHLVFICGHYEGYDERIREHLVTDELSHRRLRADRAASCPRWSSSTASFGLLPGVLGNETSAVTDSFSTGLLEYPHYTRPACSAAGKCLRCCCPAIMRIVEVWRRQQSLLRTLERRPELLDSAELDDRRNALWLAEQIRGREAERQELVDGAWNKRMSMITVVVFWAGYVKISDVALLTRTVRYIAMIRISSDSGELIRTSMVEGVESQ